MVVQPIIYFGGDNAGLLINNFVVWLSYFLICCCFAVAVRSVSKLQTKLSTTNIENAKLLDGMHEGLLILSKNDQKTMFCNKPAQKIINAFLGTISNFVE